MNGRTMKRYVGLLLCAAYVFPARAWADDAPAIRDATTATTAWLALVDAGDYPASWDQAAAFFQEKVTKSAWVSAAQGVRQPLGAIESRMLVSSKFTHALPGAPDADYVVLAYDSRFAAKSSATETLALIREKDGRWRIIGYFIK